jgi:hypothetical protein
MAQVFNTIKGFAKLLLPVFVEMLSFGVLV